MYRMQRSAIIGRNLERKINHFLLGMILIFLLPVFITTFFSKRNVEELISNYSRMQVTEDEAMLPQIVAKQIGISMPDECIKAQAVIARTNLREAMKTGKSIPEGISDSLLRELWGEEYDAYYARLKDLIAETAGETLQYNGDYIYAAYHQTSAGNTRTLAEYADVDKMPYLTSVACHEDATAENYLNVYFWEGDEFLSLIRTVFPDANVDNTQAVNVLERDVAGYALEVQVGENTVDGETFRNQLALPSACFEITFIEEDVRLVTMGCGHGFGLSQYTAEKMAESGSDYKEILNYFYKGAVITE